MKYIFLFLFLCSCNDVQRRAAEREKICNEGINSYDPFACCLLFEKDEIKVYRFYDKYHWHYFTSKNETISTQIYGKSIYFQENIKGE